MGVFAISPESPAVCPTSIRWHHLALFWGSCGKGVEGVWVFPSEFVAQGVLWVMLEDKFLSLPEQ